MEKVSQSNSNIEESLKSARRTHWMLILVCATLLSVAFHQREDYSGAIDELNAIINIDLDQFKKDSIQETNKLGRDSELAREWASAFTLSMRIELDPIGLEVSDSDTSVHVGVFCASFDQERVRSLQRSHLIRDYEEFIRDNIGVDLVDFGTSKVAKAFAEKIKDPNILRPGFLPGTKLANMIFTMDFPYHDPSGSRNFSAEMALGFQFAKYKHPPVNVTITAPRVLSVYTSEGTEFQSWLRNQGILNKLADGQPSSGGFYAAESIFPQLRSVWSDVKDRTPKEAIRVLSEKAKRKVSFFGVEIDVQQVVFAGPILVAVLLCYLWCLVLHLGQTCKDDLRSLQIFPWLPLLVSKPARCLCFVSICIMPIMTLLRLCWRFWDVGGWTSLILTVPALVLLIVCWQAMRELKKTIQ